MIYGNNSATTIEKSLSFWVIPWKLILLIIIITAVTIWLVRRGHKRYKKQIIKKHEKTKT
jgi:hypothetical protein